MDVIGILWPIFLYIIPSIWIGIKAGNINQVCSYSLILWSVNVILLIVDIFIHGGLEIFLQYVLIFILGILSITLPVHGLKVLINKIRN